MLRGGRRRRRKNKKRCVSCCRLPLLLCWWYKLCALCCLSLSLYSASKLCLHLLPLCHTLGPSHCPCVCLPVTHTSLQQPPARLACLWSPGCCDCGWLCVCVCVTRVSRRSWVFMALVNTQPHHLNGHPPERRARRLIGRPLGQWEAASRRGRWMWQQRIITQVVALRRSFTQRREGWVIDYWFCFQHRDK